MKSLKTLGAILLAAATALAGPTAAAAQQPQGAQGVVPSVTLQDIQKGVSAAAQQYAANKKALALQLKTDRRALVKGPLWKSLSQAQKNARLNALRKGYLAKMNLLRKDYKAKIMAFAKARRALVAKSKPAAGRAHSHPARRGRSRAPVQGRGAVASPRTSPRAGAAGAPMGGMQGR